MPARRGEARGGLQASQRQVDRLSIARLRHRGRQAAGITLRTPVGTRWYSHRASLVQGQSARQVGGPPVEAPGPLVFGPYCPNRLHEYRSAKIQGRQEEDRRSDNIDPFSRPRATRGASDGTPVYSAILPI